MPELIAAPKTIPAAGSKPKRIDEYVGAVSTGETGISVAHMRSPAGWVEPGQRPDFTEYTLVLKGELRVESEQGELWVKAGQAVVQRPGEWVRYSTPNGDCEYVAICSPAFSPDAVHRDPE